MLISLGFKMAIMAFLGLLMGTSYADLVPQNIPTFFDNDTLLAPNVHGEMILHTIVDMTWEVDIPGASHKINITGTADKVIEYINTNFPHYVWPDIDDLNTTSPGKSNATPDPYPKCNVFSLAPYPMAIAAQENLKQLGSHQFNLDKGPRTCSQVQCKEDLKGRRAAIWWCNDGDTEASVKAEELAEFAMLIIPTCAEFMVPMSWTRGQVFHKTMPWNVIVTGYEKCR